LRRVKGRYLLVRLTPRLPRIEPGDLREAVSRELSLVGGWMALAAAGLSVRRGLSEDEYILRCSLKLLPLVLFALTLVTGLGGARVRLDVVSISGTIRGLRRVGKDQSPHS